MEKEALLKQMTILDFMSVDLHLYLNTHPDDAEALKMYNDVIESAAAARSRYEEKCGPMTSFRRPGGYKWTWEDCPWPWQEEFNFSVNGEGCL
ncbi:MAG: spore coat protein CotJB [Clostridiales bacterium]|nr:spore coat protein CotJB [Clostridiales bacterium]